jgi:glutathione S-transferase
MGSVSSKSTSKAAKFPSEKPVLVYWELCGRGDIAKSLLYAANIEYDLDTDNANSWPAYKEQCPFGQLPVLKHGALVLAQGGAINKYCARLGGLYPTNPTDAAVCDMIIEECMDVFQGLFKAKNAADKEAKLAEWASLKNEHLPIHFGYLEKFLEKSGKPFFGGDNANAADITFTAVYGVYDHAKCGASEVLDKFPKLKAVCEGSKKLGKLADFKQ